jgi:hypothetical protein
MILNREEVEPISWKGIITRALGVVATGWVVLMLARVVWSARGTGVLAAAPAAMPPSYGSVAEVGMSLFTDFVYPFEAISLLLLVAIVGGVVVSRSHKQEEEAEATAQQQAKIRATILPERRLGPAGEEPGAHGHGADHGHAHAAHH